MPGGAGFHWGKLPPRHVLFDCFNVASMCNAVIIHRGGVVSSSTIAPSLRMSLRHIII